MQIEKYKKKNAEYEMYLVNKKFGKGNLLIHFFYREQVRKFKQGFLAYVDKQKWLQDNHSVMSEVQNYLINTKGVIDDDDFDNEFDNNIDEWRKNQFPKIDLEYGGVCYFDIITKDREQIITKDREQFLLSEMKHFGKRSIERFKNCMKDMDTTCKNCGIHYWKGCKKRCECE